MYITVIRWVSKHGCIIDAYSTISNDISSSIIKALTERHWELLDGDMITTTIEWTDDAYK